MALSGRSFQTALIFMIAGALSACAPGMRAASDKDIVTSADVYKGPTGTVKRFDESRIIDGDYEAVFRSALDVLQNAGFYIASADIRTGFIRANTPDALLGDRGLDKYLPPLPQLSAGLAWVVAAGTTHQVAIITMEDLSKKKTRVRMSVLRYLYAAGTQQGMGGFYPEFDKQLIITFFSDIDKELATRRIMRN